MKSTKWFLGILFLFMALQPVMGQGNDAQLFREGIQMYQNQRYDDAQRAFIRILKEYPSTKLLTATKLMLAKTYYKQKDYRLALIVCRNFVEKHPESRYLPNIYFLQGKIYFRQKNYRAAVRQWLWVTEHDADPRLKQKAGNFMYHTVLLYLPDTEIEKLKKELRDKIFDGLVEIVRAHKLIEKGQREEGYGKLQAFVEKHPGHFYAELARQLLKGKSGSQVSSRKVLLVKSETPDTRPVSNALAQGMLYAAYEMNARDPQKVLDVDTLSANAGVLNTLEAVLPALPKRMPLAIIGPPGNDEDAALSLLSRYEHIPFIAPLSAQNGIAAISDYAFQINPDAEIKGEFLANYAVSELKLKTFAILAPADNYGQTIARSFEQTVLQNGGEVVEQQWYYEDTQDFSPQLKAIRKKGFYIAFRDSVLAEDSTLTEKQIEEQFKEYQNEVLFSSDLRGKVDSTQVPSVGIDGLFIAIYPEYIPYIAPQFVFQNIQTTLLGNEGWNDPEQLQQQRNYLNGLIFETAGYLDPNSWNYREFTTRFRQQMQTTPNRYHLLGYDMGKWMMQNYQSGINRKEFRDRLMNSQPYKGIMEDIAFGHKPRVNNQLNIIEFKLGHLFKLR